MKKLSFKSTSLQLKVGFQKHTDHRRSWLIQHCTGKNSSRLNFVHTLRFMSNTNPQIPYSMNVLASLSVFDPLKTSMGATSSSTFKNVSASPTINSAWYPYLHKWSNEWRNFPPFTINLTRSLPLKTAIISPLRTPKIPPKASPPQGWK